MWLADYIQQHYLVRGGHGAEGGNSSSIRVQAADVIFMAKGDVHRPSMETQVVSQDQVTCTAGTKLNAIPSPSLAHLLALVLPYKSVDP